MSERRVAANGLRKKESMEKTMDEKSRNIRDATIH